ncbi:MAG: hypothetical protein ACRD3Q_04220 [Terriglobales bacterium]
MILLVSGIERRAECAAALKEALGESVAIAENALQATRLLRTETYRAVVFDEQLAQLEPEGIEIAFKHLAMAIPVEVDLAIRGKERVVRALRAALRRRKQEQASAWESAAQSLRREVNDALTTLLLDSELALGISGLPASAAERLASLHEATQELRTRLETTHSLAECR